jgi:ketosteroid isomerase-like protein
VSQENVELMRGVHEQLARGDLRALGPLLDDAVEWEWSTIEAEEFIDAGEHVVVTTRYHAWPRHGGPPIDQRAAVVWTLREGKIVRQRSYSDRAEALEAVCLRE